MTLDHIIELVNKKMRNRRGPLRLTGETVISDIGLSSLQFAEIVFTLEEDYNIELNPAEAAKAKTLADIVDVVNSAILAA